MYIKFLSAVLCFLSDFRMAAAGPLVAVPRVVILGRRGRAAEWYSVLCHLCDVLVYWCIYVCFITFVINVPMNHFNHNFIYCVTRSWGHLISFIEFHYHSCFITMYIRYTIASFSLMKAIGSFVLTFLAYWVSFQKIYFILYMLFHTCSGLTGWWGWGGWVVVPKAVTCLNSIIQSSCRLYIMILADNRGKCPCMTWGGSLGTTFYFIIVFSFKCTTLYVSFRYSLQLLRKCGYITRFIIKDINSIHNTNKDPLKFKMVTFIC